MIKHRYDALAVLLVLLFGFLLFFIGTDGFRAFTAETARVNRLIEDRPVFPDVVLEDSEGRMYPFSEFQGKYALITFIYTSCGTVCPQIEMNMAEVYRSVPSRYIGKDIVFLSISFDPTRDDPATLNQYRALFHSDGETWRMARIADRAQLDRVLKTFGVIAIPDGQGNFTHNAAFYLVDRKGRLVDVMDYTRTGDAALQITGMLEREAERQ